MACTARPVWRFLYAAGGGGWRAIVTANLLSKGATPRYAISSVNAVEFFVAATVTATFVTTVGLVTHSKVVTGLVLGGALAAPIAADVVRWLPERPLMVLVGAVIMLLSIGGLLEAVG